MMERTLVTGGSGLVGSHLRKLMPTATFVSSRDYNLMDQFDVDRLMMRGWDRVIHMSARVGGIVDNQSNQLAYLEENILMNTYFLRKARELRIPRLTGILSSCICPTNWNRYPMIEEDLLRGEPNESNYTYAMAKRIMARQIELSNQSGQDIKWNYLVPCNLYGEGDKSDPSKSHFVTALLHKIKDAVALGKDHIELLGEGYEQRQFMHAGDLARVIKEVCDRDIHVSFNVAPPENLTIHNIADVALEATGNTHLGIRFQGGYGGEVRKDISNKRMMALIPDFKFTSLRDGMRSVYSSIDQKPVEA